MRFEALVRKRVSVRAVRDEDLVGIEAWYSEAASAAYERRSLEDLPTDMLFAITQPGSDEPIGLLEYRRDDGWLAIPFVALAKAYRGWGYGSEAVRLLEGWAVREGLPERFRAEVDVGNGLGLYFWLRLGYRPAGWHAAGGRDSMAMVREASG